MTIKDYFIKKKASKNSVKIKTGESENLNEKRSMSTIKSANYISNENDIPTNNDLIFVQYYSFGCLYAEKMYADILDAQAEKLDGNLYKVIAERIYIDRDKVKLKYDFYSKELMGCVIKNKDGNLIIDEQPSIYNRARVLVSYIEKFSKNNPSYEDMKNLKKLYDNIYCMIENDIFEQCKSLQDDFKKEVAIKLKEDMDLPLNAFISKYEEFQAVIDNEIIKKEQADELARQEKEQRRKEKEKAEIQEMQEYIKL